MVYDLDMAVKLEFIDFIVRRSTIEEKYPGGWEQCLKDHAGLIGHRVWFDGHLFRDGAMSPGDIGSLVREWEERGFRGRSHQPVKEWLDFCVVESLFGGPTLPCEWILVDGDTAWLRGTEPGEKIGPENFTPHEE